MVSRLTVNQLFRVRVSEGEQNDAAKFNYDAVKGLVAQRKSVCLLNRGSRYRNSPSPQKYD